MEMCILAHSGQSKQRSGRLPNIYELGQTKLIFRFASPPAWYFFQIEIKISQNKIP